MGKHKQTLLAEVLIESIIRVNANRLGKSNPCCAQSQW